MKRGISLIVLVITIIVMIILAGVIILSLSNSGIITKAEDAVDKTNLSEVQHLATLLWSEEYLKQQEEGKIDKDALEDAVTTGLSNEKINLADYIIEVTTTGVSVTKAGTTASVPEEWRDNVIAVVDGVPIPKGFVASPYGANEEKGIKAENTKEGGLVIYELTEGETAIDTSKETQYDSWTKRNQYVWVPVDKATFDDTEQTQFKRQNFGMGYTISSIIPNNYWEVDATTVQNLSYMTPETLTEVQNMYASVKEYGGFYIARYEAGIDTHRKDKGNMADLPGIKEGTKVYSVMGKMPYTYIPWTWENSMAKDTDGAVEVSRNLYPDDETKNTTGVISTLTYSVQWDRTVQWFIDTNAMTLEEVNLTTGSREYGNYSDHVIEKADLNEGAQVWDYTNNPSGTYVDKENSALTYPKASGTKWALSTGALKAASINNIYDMAGNMWEMTMEGVATYNRTHRGGFFGYNYSSVIERYGDYSPSAANDNLSFRPSLYIKK